LSGAIEKAMKNMKRILIVDDFPSVREVLREKLELQGYACQEVENGSEALKAIETERFDLVITDNQMPVMTGLQLLQCLAERPKDQRPPAIFVTGRLSDQVAKAAQTAGAWTVMQKPYRDQELISAITRALELDKGATSNPSALSSTADVSRLQEMPA
jgi:two-component system chemotaxis response regulator CheY